MTVAVTAFKCPGCGAPLRLDSTNSNQKCESCSTQFHIQGCLCPECHQHHDTLARACRRCGTDMTRLCRRCYIPNYIKDEFCRTCGVGLDILDIGVAEHRHATVELRKKHIRKSGDIRVTSERTIDDLRSATYQAEKKQKRKRAKIAMAAREQAQQQWKVLAAIAGILFVALAVLAMF